MGPVGVASHGEGSMACAATKLSQLHTFTVGCGAHATPVIADRGESAWVVVVYDSRPLGVGDCFDFGNTTWVITGPRSSERGFVARPLRERISA